MGGIWGRNCLNLFWQDMWEHELKIKAQQLKEDKILCSVAWQVSSSVFQNTPCLVGHRVKVSKWENVLSFFITWKKRSTYGGMCRSRKKVTVSQKVLSIFMQNEDQPVQAFWYHWWGKDCPQGSWQINCCLVFLSHNVD